MNDSLVQAILDSALRRASLIGASSIRGCLIALGELVDVTPEAFRVEWQRLARGTLAENAVLQFHILPAEMQCMTCFQKYPPTGSEPACPYCGGLGAKVLSGEACFVKSIQTD